MVESEIWMFVVHSSFAVKNFSGHKSLSLGGHLQNKIEARRAVYFPREENLKKT